MKKRLQHVTLRVIAVLFVLRAVGGGGAAAQALKGIGIKAGMTIPDLTSGGGNPNPLADDYSSRLGLTAAVFTSVPVNGWLSIDPELCYSEQGGKKYGLQAITNPFPGQVPGDYLYADFRNDVKLHYVMLAVQARATFRLAAKLNLYYKSGGFAGILVSAHSVSRGESVIYQDAGGTLPVTPGPQSFDHRENIRTDLHPVNAGVIGAVGFSWRLGNDQLFIEGGGNFGFVDIQQDPANGRNYTGAAAWQLGYYRGLAAKKR